MNHSSRFPRSPLVRTFIAAMVFGLAHGLAEAGYIAAIEPSVPSWAMLLGAGALAPLALLVAGLAVLVVWLRGPRQYVQSPLARSAQWAWGDALPQLADRTARMLAWGVGLSLWVGAGTAVGAQIHSRVATPALAGALMSLLMLIVALGLLALAPLVRVPVYAALRVLSRSFTARRWLLAPGSWLTVGLVATACVVAAVILRVGKLLQVLPWAYVIGGAAGALACLVTAEVAWRAPRAFKWIAALVLGLAFGLGAFTLWLPSSLTEARAVLLGKQSVASAWVTRADSLLDVDGDGASAFYGGGDCAPFRSDIGPHAEDIPNNGIDEDCKRGDFTFETKPLELGPHHHPQPSGIAKQPNVLLITIDALSHFHTSFGGYERDTTPHLARWAQQATVFESAFSLSSSTRLSLPGVIVGEYNATIRMRRRTRHPYTYAPSTLTMASLFKREGYWTGTVTPSWYFTRKNWPGVTIGFDYVDGTTHLRAESKHHTAEVITDRAIELIGEEREKPVFLWMHYYDVHSPYVQPKGEKSLGSHDYDRYDAELMYMDRHVARLIEAVHEAWPREERVIVLTSDHGEAFDVNHARTHHDFSLHTSVLHIPLVIEAPFEGGRGKRIDGLASQLDIMPTLASLIGARPKSTWLGESLVPSLVSGQEPQKDVVYSLFYIPEFALRGKDPLTRIGVRTDTHYFFTNLVEGTERLVRWREDPLDEQDLSEREQGTANQLDYALQQQLKWFRAHERGLTAEARRR